MSEKTTKSSPPAAKRREFKALVGLTYGPLNTVVEAGEVTSDLPPESVKWLLAQGLIAPVGGDE